MTATRRDLLLLALALCGVATLSARSLAQGKSVTKRGRFLYGNDLIDIRLVVRTLDESDEGATIEPEVVATVKGTVLRVQGRLERSGIGDAFRALRLQHADGSWHEANVWVPLRL